MLLNPYRSLFDGAFFVRSPWDISALNFNRSKNRLEVHFNYDHVLDKACPFCGEFIIDTFYTVSKMWTHLPFFQFDTCMTAHIPAFKCSSPSCVAHHNREAIINTFFMDVLLMVWPLDSTYAWNKLLADHYNYPPPSRSLYQDVDPKTVHAATPLQVQE